METETELAPFPVPLALDQYDLLQSVCRESFYKFVQRFWDTIIPEVPVWNWHLKYICDELQSGAERVFRHLPKEHDVIVNIPPSTSKSTLCSIMFPAWVWTRMPECRIISASYEHNLALNFSRRSRDIILHPRYQNAFRFKQDPVTGLYRPSNEPDAVPITMKDDQNAKGYYENMAQGTRKAVGTGGNITGFHAHIILLDDLLNPKEAVSEAGLAEANRWMSETIPSRKVDKAVAITVLIMQRLHENDPTGFWLEKRTAEEVRHICLPDRLRDNVKPVEVRQYYERNGGLLDPVRLSDKILLEQERLLGSYGYAGQYEQSPAPLGAGMFEVERIQIGTPPVPIDFVEIIRYWDKAGTKDAGANSAGVKLGVDKWRRIWVLDVLYGQWSITKRNMVMHQTAEADGFEVLVGVEQEPGSGGKESAEITVTDVIPGYRVVLDRPTGDKVTRAEPLAGQVGVGNVYVPIGAAWWPAYRDELKNFPVGKKRDMVDASSGGHNLLRKRRPRVGALFSSRDNSGESHEQITKSQ